MKKFYVTDYIEINIDGEIRRRPNLRITEKVPYSLLDMGITCLVRVSALPSVHNKIIAAEIMDEEALAILTNLYPNADLSGLDVPDVEVNSILQQCGFSSGEIRRNSGKTLKEQEWGAMEKIAIYKGKDISDLKVDVKKGRCDAHEKALKRLR